MGSPIKSIMVYLALRMWIEKSQYVECEGKDKTRRIHSEIAPEEQRRTAMSLCSLGALSQSRNVAACVSIWLYET